jgi:hypothetical protein
MNTTIKIAHWLPRILCILAILFIGMFSLDAFDPKLTLGQQLLGFLMHNIPTLILIAVLIISWKWEFIGGIIFLAIGIIFTPFIFIHNYQMNHSVGISLGIVMLITFPFIVVGCLFIVSHSVKKKRAKATQSEVQA